MSTRNIDDHFLPGVSFTINGETLPARECCWAMYSRCGCVVAMHMMTVDTVTEAAAWKAMSGNAQMIKRDAARGFTLKMVKHKEVPFDDCPHSPKFGYMPPPTPAGHSWATTRQVRALHLVPLTVSEDASKRLDDRGWAHDERDWQTKFSSLCGKVSEPAGIWSRKWWQTDGKVECARCVKLAESQLLLGDDAFTNQAVRA